MFVLLLQAAFGTNWQTTAKSAVDEQVAENELLKKEVVRFGRQMMLQQFFTEEHIRSEGNSGVKLIRSHGIGLKNYFAEGHSGNSITAIHDHANNIRTVGMGEIVAVLNGVEFRTRHNDYRLYQAHSTSKCILAQVTFMVVF